MSGAGPEAPAGGGVWEEIRSRIEALERAVPPAEDLEAVWRRRAGELAADLQRGAATGEAVKTVVVGLGPDRYGVRLESLVEIQRVGRVTIVPNAPAHVAGVFNQRGRVLTLLDLRPVLGLPQTEPGARARILVVEAGGATIGLLVEEIEEIVEVEPDEVRPPLVSAKGSAEDYVSGIVPHRGRMVVLIDLERVLRAPRLVVEEIV